MVPLRASTTKSESLPDDPTAFVPSRPWNLPSITTWDDSRNQNHPTDSAEEAEFQGSIALNRPLVGSLDGSGRLRIARRPLCAESRARSHKPATPATVSTESTAKQ